MTSRVGSGIDVHPFGGEDRPLVLAGVRIPDEVGLEGHSDADVVSHAVADALLGALALGDLGSRFGVDTDDLAGADSLALLRGIVTDVADRGYAVGNLDVTIVAQRPRLAPHVDAMRHGLADVLRVDVGQVSVKATTTDHLGAIGRGEGIACWATVLVHPA